MVYCRCVPETEPDLSRAFDSEFAELRYIGRSTFDDLVRQGSMSPAERLYLPGIMAHLALWA